MLRDELIQRMDALLEPEAFNDYTVNGLQVEGRREIRKVMTGVTACQALLDEAVAWGADMVLVHHGFFWKNEPRTITGMRYHRLKALIKHDINLVAYHLPLDAHADMGNNAQLGAEMAWYRTHVLDGPLGRGVVWKGRTSKPFEHDALAAKLEARLGRAPLVIQAHQRPIQTICWCTGAAQDMIELAWQNGADAFVSGEVSERTTHIARELGISYFAAGHHATERAGIRELGNWLARDMGVEHRFVDINNPV